MPIGSDFSVDSSKNIRHTGGTTCYTVLELHRWLQDLADDAAASGNDLVDITKLTPSDRSYDTIITLVNGYNIDATAAQFIYGGSIIQGSGGTEEIWDGIEVLAPAGMYLEIIQNGALLTNFWTTGLNADSANGISHRFMVKVRNAGADIDGRRLIGITREFGSTYLEFKVNGTKRGVNVMAFTGWGTDLNNQTASGTVATWTDITNTTAGYKLLDVNADAVNEAYYSEWNAKGSGSRSIKDFYERMKYLTRRGETTTLYGIQGQLFRGITHEVALTTPRTGTFAAFEAVSWTGGTGQMLAIDSTTAGTKMWIQLLTGVAPTAGQTITGASTATATAGAGTPSTERPISTPFVGVSTGTAIIGGYGVGIETTDLGVNDRVVDLTNTQRQPPNLVTFTVGGLWSGEDYVLVGPASGGALQTNQFTLNGALTGAAVTSVVVNGSIPADTPATGSIRILRASGTYTRHAYSSWSGSTFTITSADFSTDNAPNATNCFVSYIDVLASSGSATFQANYVSDRSLFVRVRDGGVTPIKTFETVATLGSGGGSVTAIRTSDA